MTSSINSTEIAKFTALADTWWDVDGPLKTLHDINPVRLDYIQKNVPSGCATRILDVGCGGGVLSEGLARLGAKVTGLDASEEAIRVAIAHAAAENLSIAYRCKPIESFKAKPFPVITCMEMLEHVSCPMIVLKEACRLLAEGGYLFLSTINRTLKAYASAVVAAEYVLGILPKATHDFQKFIKPSELASAARSLGLEVVDITGLAYNPFTRRAELVSSVDINYLMTCRLP